MPHTLPRVSRVCRYWYRWLPSGLLFLAIQGYPPEGDDRRAVGEALARALDVWARA